MEKHRSEGTKHENKGTMKDSVGKSTGNVGKHVAGSAEKGKEQHGVGKDSDKHRDEEKKSH
ncbi:CsbD family protein [Thermomonas sp.]